MDMGKRKGISTRWPHVGKENRNGLHTGRCAIGCSEKAIISTSKEI